jgi:hypothetical protein
VGKWEPTQFDLVCWWQRCIRWLCIRASKTLKFCYYSNLGLAKLPDLLHQSLSVWYILLIWICSFENKMDYDYIHLFFKHVIFEWILFCRVTHEEELGVLEVSAHHLRWAPKGAYFWNSLAQRVLGLIMHVKI